MTERKKKKEGKNENYKILIKYPTNGLLIP